MADEDEEDGGAPAGFHILLMSPDVFTSLPLPGSGVLAIGRSAKCDVHIDDPMASREHARLHVERDNGELRLSIEDLASANGTRVRDAAIKPNERASILPGDAVIVGSTVLMVMQNRSSMGPRRLWSHAYFEARIDDECLRSATTTRASFALTRVRFTGAAHWTRVLPVLARELPPPHVFATYGPRDYEILFLDVGETQVESAMRALISSCRSAGLDGRYAVAWYPKNGTNAETLIAAANGLLNVRRGQNGDPLGPSVALGPSMQRVREMASRAASSPINVLILGECGVGKDVLAQFVHKLSPRASKPFVALNCAGLSESLMDTELFGHEKGAFTGATAAKVGLLESANGGTVFLDEIGDMPMSMQAKLLRVIETREVRPVGGLKARPIDVRFVSATNKDLEAAVVKGEFRTDLVYRLNGLTLVVPPLRERTDEIPALAESFVAAACQGMGREANVRVRADALEHLLRYRWPGNIRELKNIMERAVAMCDGGEITPEHLPLEKMSVVSEGYVDLKRPSPVEPTAAINQNLPPLANAVKQAERQRMVEALVAANGNQTRAAQLLGMPRRTFVSKLDQYLIPRPQKGLPGEDTRRTLPAADPKLSTLIKPPDGPSNAPE
ncbi:MAG TPA: sigma 54-interacting transcriptional regulator [Polyangia bacterium]|nr:sigma 54-interacting transcriptional regulator [Polyangia bacterium]